MVQDDSRTKHAFVVEMWREGSTVSAWRGLVKHVAHGHQRYFASLRDLTDFIALRLEAEPPNLLDASDPLRKD